jgi:hypothetical protein
LGASLYFPAQILEAASLASPTFGPYRRMHRPIGRAPAGILSELVSPRLRKVLSGDGGENTMCGDRLGPRRRLIRALAASLLLAAAACGGCTPVVEDELPNGNRIVQTYSRLEGIEGTRADNEKIARERCPDGFLLLKEQIGSDDEGLYRRWEYGCLAP